MAGGVRVAVVGLGRFGRLHALTAARLAEAELVGLVGRRAASLEALAGELPGVPGWTDLRRAVDECPADAWIVACSTAEHRAVAELLLSDGKTVLLEKPIADNWPDAEALGAWVKPDSANLMLGHIVLFNSEFQSLLAESRRRGSLALLDFVRHRPASIVTAFPGENPLFATMVHDLYMAQALFGRAEPSFFQARYHRAASGAVDCALAWLGWECGALASFKASYLTPAGMPPRGFDRLEVFGAGWAARICPNPRPFELWGESAEWPYALEIRAGEMGPAGMLAEEQRVFYRVVRGEQAVPAGAAYGDGLQVQRWMERLAELAGGAHDTLRQRADVNQA